MNEILQSAHYISTRVLETTSSLCPLSDVTWWKTFNMLLTKAKLLKHVSIDSKQFRLNKSISEISFSLLSPLHTWSYFLPKSLFRMHIPIFTLILIDAEN